MDALSEALSAVRIMSAVFINAEFTAPWGFSAPDVRAVAPLVAPGTERLLPFHLVSEGEATVRMDGMDEAHVAAGDVVVLPHGDAHTVSNGRPAQLLDGSGAVEKFMSGDLSLTRHGGGGAKTRFVCGFFGCERQADRLFLAGLPRILRVRVRGDPAGAWLEDSIRHLVTDSGADRPGHAVLLSKMAEALFIETLRRYVERLPEAETGWLAGARDAVVGKALAAMHRRPHHPWTVAELAAESAASRSVLTDRFARFLGESPLAYLARWRLQLAARQLRTTRKTALQVALDVGYESEAAFNRAFKREFGLPPAKYRRAMSGGEAADSG